MSLNSKIIRSVQSPRRTRERRPRVTDVTRYLFLAHFRGTYMLPEAAFFGKSSPLRPVGLQLLRRFDGSPLGLGGNRQKTALPHDFENARNLSHGALVNAQQRGAHSCRPYHPPVQHARKFEVLNVRELAGNVGLDLGAPDGFTDNCVAVRIL